MRFCRTRTDRRGRFSGHGFSKLSDIRHAVGLSKGKNKMCGFAGVVTWDERYRVSPETLKKMSASIAHRGPDGEGFHINHQDEINADHPQVALAFRRLAILDPDPRSDQPFTDGRHWLVFNGEIYNYRELRRELSAIDPNYEWRTTGDTEVLLRAYAMWGEKCVEHLNGMFAFAVWDSVEKSLYLARDRMGQKPLYYSSVPDSKAIAFASELNSIQKCGWLTRPLSISPISYLMWGYNSSSVYDLVQGVWQLPAGWQFCDGGTRHSDDMGSTPYWNVPSRGKRLSDIDAVVQTKTLVNQAVAKQLVSDVPIGVFLSGGADSSVVAACARSRGPIDTFSVSFDDARYDESKYAAAVSRHLGTKHHDLKVTPDVITDLPQLVKMFGEPFADSSTIPMHYLAGETRKHVKVALSGDGGDELFGGYDRYRAMKLYGRFRGQSTIANTFIRKVGQYIPSAHQKARRSQLKRFATNIGLPAEEQYASIMRIFSTHLLHELLLKDPGNYDEIVSEFSDIQAMNPELDDAQIAMAVDRQNYLPNDLLTKVDRCSMLHGLEVRSPFMDHELVQFAAGLTTDQLLKGGPKRMLREAFKDDLPAWVFKRKKMGFAVPIGEWFRGELRGMLRDTLFASNAFGRSHFNMKVVERLVEEHESGRVDHSQRLYALLMLELWWGTQRPS